MVSLLPSQFKRSRATKLESVAIRNFGGGWNAVDDDISMSPQYLVTQKNMHRTPSGASELRFGTKYDVNVAGVVSGDVVDVSYFANAVIVVTTDGEVASVEADGTVTAIWNSAIAAALPGTPGGWMPGVVQVSFVPFRDTLVIHNGVDKPISIDTDLVTTYLQDISTGSNANVPIGKYGCTVGNYHVVGGIPATPTTIYIASKATSGVFPGDAPPNDSISIDVGAYAPAGATEIRGIAGFRQYLLVFFLKQTAIFALGTYDAGGVHIPAPLDTLPHFGLLGQRVVTQLDKDLFIADFDGAGTATRNIISAIIDTDQLTDVIGPEFQGTAGGISDATMLTGAFAVYDRLGNRVLLFTPGGRVFVYSENAKLRYKAWSEYEYSTPFTCGCTTALGRVVLAKGTRLYTLGNKAFDELHFADLIDDKDGDWLNGTHYAMGAIICDLSIDQCYRCIVTHTSPASGTFLDSRTSNPENWEEYNGVAIPFEMELPWISGKDSMQTKQLRYLGVQTKGNAEFTVECYVDNLFKDVNGAVIYTPALSIDLIGNDTDGYGVGDEQPFGGGRRSGSPRLMRYPVKFKMIKFRIIGSVIGKSLQTIGLNTLFSKGSYLR